MSAPVIRPIGPDEVDLFISFADASPLGLKPPLATYLDGLHQWYGPEWSWVALRDGQVVARVAFSGPPEAALPLAIGSLEIGTRRDRVETGLALPRPGRLAFRPVSDDAELLAVVRGILEGTLDAHARRDVARDGVDAAARAIVEELPGPRSLERLAYKAAGRRVGITVPGLRSAHAQGPRVRHSERDPAPGRVRPMPSPGGNTTRLRQTPGSSSFVLGRQVAGQLRRPEGAIGGLRALELDPGSGRMSRGHAFGRSALRAAAPAGQGRCRDPDRHQKLGRGAREAG